MHLVGYDIRARSVFFLVPKYTSVCVDLCCLLWSIMELLPSFGVNSELSRDEFLRRLRYYNSVDQVRGLTQSLVGEAVSLNLANDGDVLVTRKKMNAGKSVAEKHVECFVALSRY